MQNCKHKITFFEYREETMTSSGLSYKWEILARCPLCKEDLGEEQIKPALDQVYSSEIGSLIANLYQYKKKYTETLSELRSNGVSCSLFPKEKNPCN